MAKTAVEQRRIWAQLIQGLCLAIFSITHKKENEISLVAKAKQDGKNQERRSDPISIYVSLLINDCRWLASPIWHCRAAAASRENRVTWKDDRRMATWKKIELINPKWRWIHNVMFFCIYINYHKVTFNGWTAIKASAFQHKSPKTTEPSSQKLRAEIFRLSLFIKWAGYIELKYFIWYPYRRPRHLFKWS